MLFRQIFDPKLAQYAYLIGCQKTREAIIIDPERDIDQYIELAEKEGLNIVAIAETHIHADFLSGGREFAERLDTRLYLSDEGDENWKYEWVKEKKKDGSSYDYVLLKDNDSFMIGGIEIQAIHTPGHTPGSTCFYFQSENLVFSGDTLFRGGIGRTGLWGGDGQAIVQSIRDRLFSLREETLVIPGHGGESSIGRERESKVFVNA